jgi:uncharacterized protein (TIGR04222 family)
MQILPLADELFLVGHDEYSGKPVVDGRRLDTGLAGAVLAELVQSERITIEPDGRLRVLDDRPAGERVTDAALAELLRYGPGQPLRAWLEHLRSRARIMVAPRLTDLGLVAQRPPRRPLRWTTRYPAVDLLAAAAPRVRVRFVMDQPELRDPATTVLGAFAGSAGLGHVFGIGTGQRARRRLERWAGQLPTDLGLICAAVAVTVAAIPVL